MVRLNTLKKYRMAEIIGLIGLSGTGKSSSIANLDPTKTFIINGVGKKLPFKNSSKMYNEKNINYFATSKYSDIIDALKSIPKANPNIKHVIIDDSTYVMSNEFMSRAQEVGFNKFTEIAIHFKKILDTAKALPEDMKVVIIGHTDLDEDGNYKLKTVGKLLDNQVNIAGLFTTLLYTHTEDTPNGADYFFVTNKYGRYGAKSPRGMFDDTLIPNDLSMVFSKMDEYYG